MSKPNNSSRVLLFALVICVVCSLILAGSSTLLMDAQQANIRLDIAKNIMICVGHSPEEFKGKKPEEILAVYRKEFVDLLIDQNNAEANPQIMREELAKLGYPSEELSAMEPADLLNAFNAKFKLLARRSGDPQSYRLSFKMVHIYQPEGTPKAYVVPIEGYGLWDKIKGFIALENDLQTVRGITFFDHKETPGLGARIEEDWFKQQFHGKKILDANGNLVSVTIVRGKVADLIQGEAAQNHVDGISGATLTGVGINKFLQANLAGYEPFFKSLRNRS